MLVFISLKKEVDIRKEYVKMTLNNVFFSYFLPEPQTEKIRHKKKHFRNSYIYIYIYIIVCAS